MKWNKVISFFLTFLLLSSLHYLGMLLFSVESNVYSSLFYGLLLSLAFFFMPISYSSFQDEWVYTKESLKEKNLGELNKRIASALMNQGWIEIDGKNSENPYRSKFKKKEANLFKLNEWLEISLIDLGSELKLILTCKAGVSYAKKQIDPLREQVNSTKEIIEKELR
jgi:hypothetical protein